MKTNKSKPAKSTSAKKSTGENRSAAKASSKKSSKKSDDDDELDDEFEEFEIDQELRSADFKSLGGDYDEEEEDY